MVVVVVNKGHNNIPFQYTHKQSELNGRMKNSERRLQLTYFFFKYKAFKQDTPEIFEGNPTLCLCNTNDKSEESLIDFRRLRCGFFIYRLLNT